MSIRIPIISDFDSKGLDRAVHQFGQLETKGAQAQFALEKAALPAAVALGALAVAGGLAVRSASDLAETQNKVAVVFGEASDEVLKFSQTSAKALGQSKTEALSAASSFGVFGKAAGLAGQDLSKFSTNFVTLASDLASFNNTSPQDAINAIGSALRGEAEPLRRYGVLLNDATLKQAATTLGIYNGTGALTAQQKVLAAQKVIYEQTTDAQGDFARTSDGLANQSRILKATLADTTAQFGTALLPAVQAILPYFVSLADFASKNTGFIGALAVAVGVFSGAILLLNVALKAWKVAGLIATAVNYALATSITAVQVATGIGIIAVGAGIAAFVAYKSQMKNLIPDVTNLTNAQNGLNDSLGRNLAIIGPKGMIGPQLSEIKDKTTGAAIATESWAKALKEGLNDALKNATDQLNNAKDAFNNFANSVKDSIKAGVNFGAIYQLMTSASQDAASASDDLTKARADLTKAIASGDIEDVTKAQLALTAAQKADTIATKENKKTFMGRLTDQVQGVKDYAANLKELLIRGLSQDALQLVLDSGNEAGMAIATELLKGTTETITGPEGLNALVESANTAANEVGLQSAGNWYQSGIDSAQKIVDGIQATLTKLTPALMAKMDEIAKKLHRTVNITVQITEQVSRIVSTITAGGIPKLAEGGIVNGPTLAMIGENGPEAVVPLSQGAGMGTTINITGVITEAQAGSAIVNALRRYNQLTGPINISVA